MQKKKFKPVHKLLHLDTSYKNSHDFVLHRLI